MRRVFYVALGATIGVLAVRKVSQAAQRWTPAGLAEQAGGVGERVATWWEIVKDQAMVREAELREALGIDEGPGSSAA
ncbi:MAG TPA: hypothetical protein VHA79_11025 [Mycobacteriales bacterium]|jgi:hypothetical protein|nr:hypothetical protein [Mycobacteriales bacterium]